MWLWATFGVGFCASTQLCLPLARSAPSTKATQNIYVIQTTTSRGRASGRGLEQLAPPFPILANIFPPCQPKPPGPPPLAHQTQHPTLPTLNAVITINYVHLRPRVVEVDKAVSAVSTIEREDRQRAPCMLPNGPLLAVTGKIFCAFVHDCLVLSTSLSLLPVSSSICLSLCPYAISVALPLPIPI